MNYRVELTPTAEKDLSRLPKRQAQLAFDRLRRLGRNADTISHRTLAGQLRGVFRLRIGDYRALYTLDHANARVIVHIVRHRRDVYRV